MAYAEERPNRALTIGTVALVHAGIGAALLSGLVVDVVSKPKGGPLTIFPVPIETPPPEIVPPPMETRAVAHLRAMPETRDATPEPQVPTFTETENSTSPAPTMIDATPTLTPAPAPAETHAADLSRGTAVRGNQGDWFPQDSYPSAALRAGAEGTVGVTVDIGVNGRATACRVTSSSGNADLDATTCRLAIRNGRFQPALDRDGRPANSTTTLRNVRWRING